MKLAKWRMGTIATIIPNSHVTYRCGANGHNGTIHDQGERKYIYDIQVHAEKHVAKCETCRSSLLSRLEPRRRGSEEMAAMVDALVSDPWTPRPASVSDEEWDEVRQLAKVENLLSIRQAPPLEQDPVAAMLGLIPDPNVVVDGSAIKRLRGKVSVSQIAARLQASGWDVSAADVRDWQARPGVVLPPALLERLANVMGVTVEGITRRARQHVAATVGIAKGMK